MPTEKASSGDEDILAEPLATPSMIESLLHDSCSAEQVLAAVSEEDSSDDSSISETEIKEALSRHVEPYVPPVSGFVVCRTKAKLRRLH